MSIYDSKGQCIVVNDAICKIAGAIKEQMLAQNYNEIESWKTSGLLDSARQAVTTKKY